MLNSDSKPTCIPTRFVFSIETTNTNLIVFYLTQPGIEHIFYCTQGKHIFYRTQGKHIFYCTQGKYIFYCTQVKHIFYCTQGTSTYSTALIASTYSTALRASTLIITSQGRFKNTLY